MAAAVAARSAHQADPIKTAEHLFETQNVAQIREVDSHSPPSSPRKGPLCMHPHLFSRLELLRARQVEQQMRSDIENKKQQLRLLVGDSYR